jgi:hypothetical protein
VRIPSPSSRGISSDDRCSRVISSAASASGSRLAHDRRPAHERADRPGPVGCSRVPVSRDCDEPALERGDHERHALRCPEHLPRVVGLDEVAGRVLVSAYRRSGAEPAQERPCPEHLALADKVDEAAVVQDLHGAVPHQVQEPRGLARLLEHHGPCRELLGLHPPGQLVQPVALHGIERSVAREERGYLHPRTLCPQRTHGEP